MRVLVTGGSGFIGSAVVAELKNRDHVPDVFELPDDIRDAPRIRACVDGHDAVIHLAGKLGTHELFDAAAEAATVNVVGTVNVLEACIAASARYVGITMPQVFPSIYTATKVGALELERAYRHNYNIPVSRVRAFNAFGSGQRCGQLHPQKIIPTFATAAWTGFPIPIWGDGDQTVDLVHVDDLARLLVDALDHGDDVTFDGGTGVALTVNEVADFVLAITGSAAGVEHLPMRRGEIPSRIVAQGAGWERLDWEPKFSWVKLAETVRAYR